MISGSARLLSTAAANSLRHTSMFRRHTEIQRVFISTSLVSQVSSGELEKHVFQASGSVQIDQIAGQTLNERRNVLPVTKHRVSCSLDARCKTLRTLHPRFIAVAMHFEHLR